ncbi:MAG: PfkB family carbohydrate kinase [Coprococcus sp.]
MTIKEIAALAKVSPGTVSKVLNNKDDSISVETRKKVLQIAREQNYRPYAEALESKDRRSYLLGVLIPEGDRTARDTLRLLERNFSAGGYSIAAGFYGDSGSLNAQIRRMRSRNVDALLAVSSGDEADYILKGIQEALPVFKIGGIPAAELSCLLLENPELLGYKAADYLIRHGHRDVGILGVSQERMDWVCKGCARAFFEQGLVFDETNVCCDEDAASAAHQRAHALMNRNVTAIICETADIVGGVYQTCMRHGLRIPEDMSVICLEDSELARVLKPGMSAVTHPAEQEAAACAAAVLRYLEEKEDLPEEPVSPAYTVVERESTSEPVRECLSMQSKVLVIGSMNMDETIHVKILPGDGETILSDRKVEMPGGKGANQAVGIAKLGGTVYAMGRIGNDIDGRKIYAALKASGVMTEGILFDACLPTGKAYIHAADNGEGTIVVYPGANGNFTAEQIDTYRYLFERVGYCLLPVEIMAEPMMHALRVCKEYGVTTIVKPALQTEIPEDMLSYIDYLIPNEKELNRIVTGSDSREEKMDRLLAAGVGHVIVTLGSRGCHLKDSEYNVRMDAPDFEPVDVTGAADAFIAAFTVCLNMGYDIIMAMCYASYAAGISITRMGVQPALAERMMMEVYQDEIRRQVMRLKAEQLHLKEACE